MTASVRRALAVALLAAAIFAGPLACQASPGPAACPSGQQREAVHGTWQCSSAPDPVTGACPAGTVLTFTPGEPMKCSGKGRS